MISIIVPIYNAAQFLEPCLRSCLDQDYADLEVICVNDGSTDNSSEILDLFSKEDGRIKVIDQSNSGVVVARKNGILAAKGEYIFFLDADDLLLPSSLTRLAVYCPAADIVSGGWITYVEQETSLEDVTVAENCRITEGLDSLKTHFLHGPSFLMGRLIKKSLFSFTSVPEHLKFDEDFALLSQLFYSSQKSVFFGAPVFAHRDHDDSVTKSCDFNAFQTWQDSMLSVESFLSEKRIQAEVGNEWACRRLIWEFGGLRNGIVRFAYSKTRLRELAWKSLVLNPLRGIYCLRNLSGSMKIFIPLCLISPVISARLCLYYSRKRSGN